MYDLCVMCSYQSVCGLLNDAENPRKRDGFVFQDLAKCTSLDELGRKKAAVLILAYLIDGNDVGVI